MFSEVIPVTDTVTDADFNYCKLGVAFLLTVEAFCLQLSFFALQSLKALIRRTFPL